MGLGVSVLACEGEIRLPGSGFRFYFFYHWFLLGCCLEAAGFICQHALINYKNTIFVISYWTLEVYILAITLRSGNHSAGRLLCCCCCCCSFSSYVLYIMCNSLFTINYVITIIHDYLYK